MEPSTSQPMASPEAATDDGVKFKGVRRRKWGKWVSEIRLPNSRARIWLGSYDSPEKAARAFDAAVVCLRGQRDPDVGRLNFPSLLPKIPSPRPLTPQLIQAAAARHALHPPSPSATLPPSQAAHESSEAPDHRMDWSFIDQCLEELNAVGDEFEYGYFPTAVQQLPPPDTADHGGSAAAGSGSFLWNF